MTSHPPQAVVAAGVGATVPGGGARQESKDGLELRGPDGAPVEFMTWMLRKVRSASAPGTRSSHATLGG